MPDEPTGTGDKLSEEHVLALVYAYERTLEHLGYSPVAYPDISERCGRNIRTGGKYDCLNHSYWMCERVRTFVRTHRWSKALRWLGTVQGILIMGGVFSIEEIMAHDRTAPDARKVAELLKRDD